jgi:hypothetical protein
VEPYGHSHPKKVIYGADKTAVLSKCKLKETDPDTLRYAQFSRIVRNPPRKMNLDLLALLIYVMRCHAEDIFHVHFDDTPPIYDPAAASTSRKGWLATLTWR